MKRPERINLVKNQVVIEKVAHGGLLPGKELYLWRDELTEFVGSGNKIRKLEFLLADALRGGATDLVTCGGPQSNHARATVYMARKLGLGVHVVVRLPKEGVLPSPANGNRLLMQIAGAEFCPVSYQEYQNAGGSYEPFLQNESDRLREQGCKPYVIGEGGSSPLGCFGYFTAAQEMLSHWKEQNFGKDGPDSIFIALGSGGTHAGLHLGLEHCGVSTDRLFAVNVCDDEPYFRKRVGNLIEATCEDYNLKIGSQALQILDGHVGAGYSLASDEDLQFYSQLANQTGVLLDPCYTGKAFQGMIREVKKNPGRFGEKVLFLHSGGAFANFHYAAQYERVLSAQIRK